MERMRAEVVVVSSVEGHTQRHDMKEKHQGREGLVVYEVPVGHPGGDAYWVVENQGLRLRRNLASKNNRNSQYS